MSPSSSSNPFADQKTDSSGWGFLFRFVGNATQMFGLVTIEFKKQGRPNIRTLVTMNPAVVNDIDIHQDWLALQYEVLKRSLNPSGLIPEVMEFVQNEFKRSTRGDEWQTQAGKWLAAGSREPMTAECLRILKQVVEGEYTGELRFVKDISGKPGPAAPVAAKAAAAAAPILKNPAASPGSSGPAKAAAGIPPQIAALFPNKILITMQPVSDAFQGMRLGELQDNDEVFIKLTDDGVTAKILREALGAVDEEGALIPICVPLIGTQPIDDRGNSALVVRFTEDVYGVGEVNRSVKLKTMRSVIAASATSGYSEDDQPGERSLLPWLIGIGIVLLVAAAFAYVALGKP